MLDPQIGRVVTTTCVKSHKYLQLLGAGKKEVTFTILLCIIEVPQ